MSIALPIEEDPRFRRYTASQGQKVFSVPFPFQQDEDLSIRLFIDGAYSEIDRSLFTLSGAMDPQGGSIAFHNGRSAGEIIVIVGAAILERLSSIVRDGRFSSKVTDDEFDRNRLIQQEQRRETNRALKFDFDVVDTKPLPRPERGKALVGNPNGTGYVNAPVGEGDIAIAVIEATKARDDAVVAKDAAVQSDVNAGSYANTASIAASEAIDAKNAAVSAATSLHNYDTLAQANADLMNIPENAGVNIVADGDNNGFYVKQAGVLIKKSDATLPGLQSVTDRISRAVDVLDPSQEFAHILQDKAGFFNVYFKANGAMRNVSKEQDILGLRIIQDDNDYLVFTDRLGFVLLMIDENGVDLVGKSGGGEDQVISIADCMPYFSSRICGVVGQEIGIFLTELLADRGKADLAQLSLVGINGYTTTSDDVIRFMPEKLGDTAQLTIRPRKWSGGARLMQNLAVSVAPVPAVAPVPKNILLIGDSIGNRQGAFFLNQYLTNAGYLPNFIGTVQGSASPANNNDTAGPMGESREGWETGDFTYTMTDRAIIVEPGQETTYLSGSKAHRVARNPFLRVATGGDPSTIVRNGFVLDFGFYQSRFSLPTPDIVIYALGTNDIRDQSEEAVGEIVYDNDKLLLSRLRTAWPGATIIRTLPGTSREITRDPLWSNEYIPVIRGIMRALNDLNDSKNVLAPLWAMVNQDAGYSMSETATDPVTGVVTAVPIDPIHPINGNRAAIYRALSGYVACAMSGII